MSVFAHPVLNSRRCYHSTPMDRASRRKEILAAEPALDAVTRGLFEGSVLVSEDEPGLEQFAHDARALFGFDRLPEPASSWTARLLSGELAVDRKLEMGRL